MSDFFLRLELDRYGIKAMVVEQNYKKNLIKDHGHVLFENLLDPKEKQEDLFSRGMDVIVRDLDLEACSTAVIFLSQAFISFRNIVLPFRSGKKIRQILPFELESLLPAVDKDYVSDFHMDFFGESGESNMVLTASISESVIEKYFLKLEGFKIKPLIITHCGYAAAIGFLKKQKNASTFAFLHINDGENTLVLVNNKKPCAVRTLPVSNSSPEQLALFVKQTIMAFNQKIMADLVFDVFVSSDGYDSKTEAVFSALGKTSEIIPSNPLLLNISPDKPGKYLLNFCKGKYGTDSFFKMYFTNIAACAALFVCSLVLLMAGVVFDNAKLNKKIAAIDGRAYSIFQTTFPDKKTIRDPYLQMKANARVMLKKSGMAKGKDQIRKEKDMKVLDIMQELSGKINSTIDIDISRFLLNGPRLILSGSTDAFNNVDNIKSKIESSRLFKKVSISSAAADKKGSRVNFKFIIEM